MHTNSPASTHVQVDKVTLHLLWFAAGDALEHVEYTDDDREEISFAYHKVQEVLNGRR